MITSSRPTLAFLLAAAAFPIAASALPDDADSDAYVLHEFERRQLSDVFYCEGATYGDVSGDGVNDLVSGPFWYQGPDFEKRHEYSEPKTHDPKGYSDNFFAFVRDFNADGRNDILIIGFPGKDASWFENPGAAARPAAGHWKRHVVFDVVDNESPTFADLTGDGRPELICQTGGRFGYAAPDWDHPERKWTFVAISEDRGLGRYTHGLGHGDVNGDGRSDILERTGWYEQPASLDGNPLWKYHPFPFSGPGGAQMYPYDVDEDGDADVITSLAAHGRGLAWWENVREAGEITFRPHIIMPGPVPERERWEAAGLDEQLSPRFDVDFSNLHAIDLVDMDGDGLKDIVTGKRFWAHFNEPEAGGVAVSYWFRLVRGGDGEVEYVPYLIDDDSGVGTQVVAGDVNGDGLPDLVVGNKKGTFYIEHRTRRVTREEWERAQPRRVAVFHRGGLSPQRAVAEMTVPEGFRVELVAAEPDIHQPIAFAIDHRGRIWVAEGHTYPLRVHGRDGAWNEGKDRIVILGDADGDGAFEKRSVFAEGINLVSGLEVGFGGVWVGAAPYLLFFPDRDGDDRPDGDPEVLLDGWGLEDTHETLNSFIWGPDGWLYGCHGVFTHSRVGKPGTPPEERVPLNAGFWRFHPTRREFEVFAWGTSNPWGIDFDDRGQAFATACVIPHLYHVIQGARYQRQAGRHFDAHVYDDIKTIADHRHWAGNIQDHAWWGHEPRPPADTLAAGGGHAHCGALLYLGDNFPPEYRGRLFMSNIHGNRINTDLLERRGSGFVGRHGEDLLIANDAWFRGIDLQCGPAGGVYLIDWYDRNACHRVQPLIWDRSNGRMYRVTHAGWRPRKVDLAALGDEELVALQLERNDWHPRVARRLLQERGGSPGVRRALLSVLRENPDDTRQLRALWCLHGIGGLVEALALETLASSHEHVRAWTVQLIAEDRKLTRREHDRLVAMARDDPSPVVRLYLASALQRLPAGESVPIAAGLLGHGEDADDHNLSLMVWYGLEPITASLPGRAMELALSSRLELVTRAVTRSVASEVTDLEPLMGALAGVDDDDMRALILGEMLEAFRGHVDIAMPDGWKKVYDTLVASRRGEVRDFAHAVAVRFGDRRVFPALRATLTDRDSPLEKRRHAMTVLLDGRDPDLAPVLRGLLDDADLRGESLRALAGYADPATPPAILDHYAGLADAEKRDAIATLAARPEWALELLGAVRTGAVPRRDVTAYTVRQLRSLGDERVSAAIEKVWGVARETSEDTRARIEELKGALTPERLAAADLPRGRQVYDRICSQCHKLFGAGASIAPDITGSNRANLDYVLETLIDPNALVGKDYQMHVFVLRDGRLIAGLVLGETGSAFTVKTPTDEVVVPKRDVVRREQSPSSLMPEGLLDDLAAEEVRDLAAYLASPTQVPLRGEPVEVDRETRRVAGAIEGESLKVLEKTRGDARPQGMEGFGRDRWSGNNQLWWTGARPGDRLRVAVPVERAGSYRIDVALTRARDYGVVQLSWDGEKVESPIDLYDPQVVPTGTLRLGERRLEAGEHVLGVEIVGANPKAIAAHMFGLDYVLLTAVE